MTKAPLTNPAVMFGSRLAAFAEEARLASEAWDGIIARHPTLIDFWSRMELMVAAADGYLDAIKYFQQLRKFIEKAAALADRAAEAGGFDHQPR